jgi:hypothetical protein
LQIDDLTKIPENHPPSPYSFPVPLKNGEIWGYGILPDKLPIFTIGWLGDFLPEEGEVDPICIDRLWQAFTEKQIIIDGTAGWHDCELCDGKDDWYPDEKVGPVVEWRDEKARIRGYGHFLLSSGQKVYMTPTLILHYIIDHGYKPPLEFVETAMGSGNILGMDDLKWIEDWPSNN